MRNSSVGFSTYTLFFALLFLGVTPSTYPKSFCALLWANQTTETVPINIEFDNNINGVYELPINAGGLSTAIYSYSENMNDIMTVEGSYRYWIQYNEEWQVNNAGIKYRISSNLEPAQYQAIGVKTVMSPNTFTKWTTYGCRGVNETYNFSRTILRGMTLELSSPYVTPGEYKLDLPITVAYEENKGLYDEGWPRYSFLMTYFKPIKSQVSLRVKPKCQLLSNNISINIGDSITPLQASYGITKNIDISINCNYNALLKWSLIGSEIVDGIKNRTICGRGYCELTFSNKKGEIQSYSPSGTSKQQINVTYKDDNAIEGVFSGSAILSVEVL